ncbi:MAG TPA: hypothetical protein VGD22_15545 [Sphingobacteriaceae bacterium]
MLFIIILFISLILQMFLPWWIIAIVALTFSARKAVSGKHAFVHSFTAIFTLWIAAGLLKTIPNENILANRVGEMLMLPFTEFNWVIILFVTGIIGGLVAGLSGLAGFYLRELFIKKKT